MPDNNSPYWLDSHSDPNDFPDPELALSDPSGLLAVGGDLSPERLLSAYVQGIFPWYSSDQPILWWSPNPRSVLYPEQLKIRRSLRKRRQRGEYRVDFDTSFAEVIGHCSEPRIISGRRESGTWITPEMADAYTQLHQLGFAHSVESRFEGELVGGLYGVAIGGVFFGESMFSRRSDASKIAFVELVEQLQKWGFQLIDCQIGSELLRSFGAIEIPRSDFIDQLHRLTALQTDAPRERWCKG